MQDFVEKFIAAKQAEWGEKCDAALAPREAQARAEREARLIRLGMCRKEYSDSQVFSRDYPYQERKTGRFYRLAAFEVTDEEYAAICRYDNITMELHPTKLTDRLYGKGAKNYRRTAALRFVVGFLLSAFAGVILYLLESDYFLVSLLVFLFGILHAHLAAVHTYTSGKTLERVEQIMALAEQKMEK